mmetsp:Transcript_66508/g.185409  ORF Transcript_66508/g.185409 Transcript_66508/m.185409 type:complete len:192 (+) Transcript_66508:580-1155(+)
MGEPLIFFKGVTHVQVKGGFSAIANHIAAAEARPLWDKTCMFSEVVEAYKPFYQIMYLQIRSPAPFVSNRDIVLLGRLRLEENGSVLFSVRSTEYHHLPERPDFVRADFRQGGYIVRPTADPEIIQVTFAGFVDVKGWLPDWVKSFVMWEQGLTLEAFRSYIQRLETQAEEVSLGTSDDPAVRQEDSTVRR